jgi:hypothetical protein
VILGGTPEEKSDEKSEEKSSRSKLKTIYRQ